MNEYSGFQGKWIFFKGGPKHIVLFQDFLLNIYDGEESIHIEGDLGYAILLETGLPTLFNLHR